MIFIPVFVRTRDLSFSFQRSIPLLFICACTFIANDLDDVEADKINHSARPLPSGDFSARLAVLLYFTFLGLALFSIRFFVPTGVDFLYYALLSLSISYDYVVEYFPGLKSLYVAFACSLPVAIVAVTFPLEPRLDIVVISAFLMSLGREVCMDIRDRPGDAVSFLHNFNAGRLACLAIIVQAVGQSILILIIHESTDVAALFGMALFLGLSALFWFKLKKLKLALILMKVQFFAGLYFLT